MLKLLILVCAEKNEKTSLVCRTVVSEMT